MTLEEFTERTGIYPDQMLYRAIENYYNIEYDVFTGKDTFFKAYKENANGLAETIQRDADEAIDRELEWKPCKTHGTNMNQDKYDELAEICTGMDGQTHFTGEEEAKKLVAEMFGFSSEKIEIVGTVRVYEINRHGRLRKAAEYKRQPLYNDGDSNYIRFNVRCADTFWPYKMVNGLLKQYQL